MSFSEQVVMPNWGPLHVVISEATRKAWEILPMTPERFVSQITTATTMFFSSLTAVEVCGHIRRGKPFLAWDDNDKRCFLSPYAVVTVRSYRS